MKRTVCVVRRRKREALSKWPWRNIFDPTLARPDELKTDLRDGNERRLGEIAFSKFRIFGKSYCSTPWGEAHLDSRVWTRIFLGERLLASFKSPTLGAQLDIAFPDRAPVTLHQIAGNKESLETSVKGFYLGIFLRKGTAAEEERDRQIRLTRDEIKRLPRKERPRSIEGDEFVELSIVLDGTPPIPEGDLVASVAVLTSWAVITGETGEAMILKSPGSG